MNGKKAKAIKRYVYGSASSKSEDRRYMVTKPEGKFWLIPVPGQEITHVFKLQKLHIEADPLRQAYQHAKRRLRHVPISTLPQNSPLIP